MTCILVHTYNELYVYQINQIMAISYTAAEEVALTTWNGEYHQDTFLSTCQDLFNKVTK